MWVRFRWVGTWGYSWEIDDINIVDIEENDTRIDGYLSYTNYFQTGVYENGAWAQSQLLDTLFAGAKVYNFGYGTQENVVLDIEVERNHVHLRHGVDVPECSGRHPVCRLLCRRWVLTL